MNTEENTHWRPVCRVKWEVIQRRWFHKYPAAPAALTHTACFLQEGRRASRKLLDTNNGSGKDSDSVTDRGEGSWVPAANCRAWPSPPPDLQDQDPTRPQNTPRPTKICQESVRLL